MDKTVNERMRRYRNKKCDVTVKDVTVDVTRISDDQRERFPDIPLPFGPAYYAALNGKAEEKAEESPHEAPAILRALLDPEKRLKLEKITQSLGHRGLKGEVRYGIDGPDFEIVDELLKIT